MHQVKRLKIGGFRRLYDVGIDMRPLMVMIGANGAGKTSLLDAISLLSASTHGHLSLYFTGLVVVLAAQSVRQQLVRYLPQRIKSLCVRDV
jgi:predicted ATPase